MTQYSSEIISLKNKYPILFFYLLRYYSIISLRDMKNIDTYEMDANRSTL
jgi:hypothetical protein